MGHGFKLPFVGEPESPRLFLLAGSGVHLQVSLPVFLSFKPDTGDRVRERGAERWAQAPVVKVAQVRFKCRVNDPGFVVVGAYRCGEHVVG